MKINKWLLSLLVSVSSVVLFSVTQLPNNQTNWFTPNVSANSLEDQQAINELMPNQKLQQLVLINMKLQHIVPDSFTMANFTPATFKSHMEELTSLNYPTGTREEANANELVDGGNGAFGPTSVNPGNYSLKGVELATNLTHISLQGTLDWGKKLSNADIVDISPLRNLTKLTYIDLRNNRISDISPIAKLPKVTTLYINDNCISNLNVLDASQYTQGFNYLGQVVILPVQRLHSNSYTWKAPFVNALPKGTVKTDTKPFQPYSSDNLEIAPRAYGYVLDGNNPYKAVQVFRNGTYDMNTARGTTTISGDDFVYKGLSPQISPSVDTVDPWGTDAKVVQNPYNYYMMANYIYSQSIKISVLTYLMPYTITPRVAQSVTVQYVDEQGNSIHAPQVITGAIGKQFDLSTDQYKLKINGYTFKKYDPAQTGTISDAAQTFKLVYTKNSAPVTPVTPNQPVNPTPTPTTPVFPAHPTLPDGTQLPNYAEVKGGAVYALKKVYLYKNANFKQSQRIASYTKKPRINRPMFVVLNYAKDSQGRLRYYVKDVNHHSKTVGKKGYLTAAWRFVRPVYYQSNHRQITVINPTGVYEYTNKNLTGKIKNVKQGTTLNVTKIVRHNLTTRYQLTNGHYVTGNRKLVMNGKAKQPQKIKVKKAIYRYNNVDFGKRTKFIKKGTVLKVKSWTYSDRYSAKKHGTMRYHIAGGYITANKQYVKVYY